MKKYENPTFAIISLGYLGDTILVEPLCRNIKDNFPNSQIIFIVNDVFKEIPLGFNSVDKIICYDKYKAHKGIGGFLKFILNFPYKKIDYAIITHPHERSIIAAKAIGAKNIISLPMKRNLINILINRKIKSSYYRRRITFKGDINIEYLSGICDYKTYPVQYLRKDIDVNKIIQKFNLPLNYTVLSPYSKEDVKDWDYNNIKDFILKNKKKTVLVGTDKANKIAIQLKNEKVDFIDLTNKTTITELGAIIKSADICISVDTGTFHFSYAQNVNTIGLFFNNRMSKEWAPKTSEFVKLVKGRKFEKNKIIICLKDITANDVLEKMREFEHENNKCMSIM